MTRAYLALGANLGNREEHMQRATDLLAGPHLVITRKSSVYETEPVGLREQPWFLNSVVEIETSLSPLQLLHRCHQVELELGRERKIVNGPRMIDVDILLYGDVVMSTEELTIPHPRYRQRRFALAPLAEIASELRDPLTGETPTEMLERLEGQPVRRLK